ncbi:HNH endonuclease signature motif containing protein [Corynebacterium sp.]|uniref:HNH endonuclease signature motif containing protein n=1 Tax=Corynebacterium sp. TaxID=1720 RepID=UPI002A90ADDA|nr:HNH endonuclease signature motif containing protein [Corynebacterium sp.]MDY5784681.1 HNH endonuclease signature motif containing protein [Corynebacterium sp.]
MEGFYTVNTPGDPLAEALTATRRAEYELFQANRPPIDADFEEVVDVLAAASGRSVFSVTAIVFALHRLDELPRLREVQETLFHLDFARLIAIDNVLGKLGPEPDPEVLARIDAAVARYLTPRRPRQVLPSVANLRRKLNALVAVEDPSIDPAPDKERPPTYDTTPAGGGRVGIYAEYSAADALLIDAAVSAAAKEFSISEAEALKGLVLGEMAAPKVVLHTYRASDVDHAPGYVRGFGWVDGSTAELLASKSSRTVDLDGAGRRVSPSYVTPDLIKRAVEARDGTCRYPHCSRPAAACQKDHCVDFADGGPTAAFNLVSLCQHHHNVKTDKRATYVIDPATDDVVWLFADGHWERTEATGPTAAASRNWVQTVGQAIDARRAATQAAAKRIDTRGDGDGMSENPTITPVDDMSVDAPPF